MNSRRKKRKLNEEAKKKKIWLFLKIFPAKSIKEKDALAAYELY